MHKINKLYVLGLAIIALAIVLLVYGYSTGQRNLVAFSLQKALPAKFVSGKVISVFDINTFVQIGQRIDPSASREALVSNRVEQVKAKVIAQKQGLNWEQGLEDELQFYKSNTDENYSGFLQKYFQDNEPWFIKYVVEPSLIDAKLKIAFYSNNKQFPEYRTAQAALDELADGAEFDELAKNLSEDEVSKQFGGDLGFFTENEILPELFAAIKGSSENSLLPAVVVSREGYHLVLVVEMAEQGREKLWHIKHILLKPAGYNNWFEQESSQLTVRSVYNYGIIITPLRD